MSRKDFAYGALLMALPLLVFWPTRHFSFLNFDDDVYVTANAHVLAGLSLDTVRWAFSNAETGHFHPLTWLSHALDVTVFGLDAGAHHLTSVVLHAFGTFLCFVFWRRARVSFGVALFAAALFAVHPLRIESVAWVSTRKDVLSGVLFFLTLIQWLRWVEAPSRWRMLGVCCCYFAALLAKPTVLPLPVLLLALDVWPLNRGSGRNRFTEKLPLWMVMVIFAGIAFWGQRASGALVSLDALPWSSRLSRGVVALMSYWGRIVVPTDMSIFHRSTEVSLSAAVMSGTALVLVSLMALRRHVPAPLVLAWWWFVALLLPVCGFVQIGGQSTADRWLYLPLSGVLVGFASALGGPTWLRMSLGVACVGASVVGTSLALPTFASSERVFEQALAVDPQNFLAHNNLGLALEQKGDWLKAAQHYEESVRLNPTWPTALGNLGVSRARQQRWAEAEDLFTRALARSPSNGLIHYNLALTLALQRRMAEALPHYALAAQERPTDAQAALGHGAALIATGRLEDGRAELRRSLRLDPTSVEAQRQLEGALASP